MLWSWETWHLIILSSKKHLRLWPLPSEVFSTCTQAAIFPGWGVGHLLLAFEVVCGRTTFFFSLASTASGARTHTQVMCQEWQPYRPAHLALHIRVGDIDHGLPEQQGFPSASLLTPLPLNIIFSKSNMRVSENPSVSSHFVTVV